MARRASKKYHYGVHHTVVGEKFSNAHVELLREYYKLLLIFVKSVMLDVNNAFDKGYDFVEHIKAFGLFNSFEFQRNDIVARELVVDAFLCAVTNMAHGMNCEDRLILIQSILDGFDAGIEAISGKKPEKNPPKPCVGWDTILRKYYADVERYEKYKDVVSAVRKHVRDYDVLVKIENGEHPRSPLMDVLEGDPNICVMDGDGKVHFI